MPQKTQDILAQLHTLANHSSDINTYLFKLNTLIIQNNISDKTVLADPAHKVASWNIGCGGYWVVKSSLTKLEKPRKRGRESSSANEEDRSEMERVQIAQAVIESLHQKDFELVFLQEGPSTEYLTKNPEVNAQGLGLKIPANQAKYAVMPLSPLRNTCSRFFQTSRVTSERRQKLRAA